MAKPMAAEPRSKPAIASGAGGPLVFTLGSWFTWTAIGVALPALGLFLISVAGSLARGAWETLPVLASTHVATLGWVTMMIMGAAAQMAPALLGARIRGEATLPYQYGVFTLGALLIVIGFTRGQLTAAAAGGAGVALASLWFVVLILWTGRTARPTAAMPAHLPVAFACFGLVVLWGTVLALNLWREFWPGLLAEHRGVVVHLTLGLGGWFGLMVVGTFYRVVPLIHGARVASGHRGLAILLLVMCAIFAIFAGVAAKVDWAFRVAAFLASAALLLFGSEIVHVLRRRRRRAGDLNVSHWYAVAAYSAALGGVAAGWGIWPMRSDPPDRLGECVVVLFLLGWVTQAMIGQLYKITPFLMWYYRATLQDMPTIPHNPNLYRPRVGDGVFWSSNAGVLLVTIGIWERATSMVQVGAVVMTLSALALAYMLAYRWIPSVLSGRLPFQWGRRIS